MVKKKGVALFEKFIKSEQSSGVILIFCTVLSLLLANSSFGESYGKFWHWKIGPEVLGLRMGIGHWVNDGLMTIFFLFVGLEIKREIIEGELSSIKNALLPIGAAIGGMIVPAVFYLLVNIGSPDARGWGIPMATDIAFAVGILALLGNRIPFGLKVMLTALAIVDDLGAILVIALFYTSEISVTYLIAAVILYSLLLLLNKYNVKALWIYIGLGVFLWYFVLKSGIHATIAGVLLAMALPLGKGKKEASAEKLEHFLAGPVAYFIMPVFAFCNTGFELSISLQELASSGVVLGIILGLCLGKPIGIFTFSYIMVKNGLTKLPSKTSLIQILGTGFLGGIGFTMSIFISLIAFNNATIVLSAKVAILVSSVLSGAIGYLILRGSRISH